MRPQSLQPGRKILGVFSAPGCLLLLFPLFQLSCNTTEEAPEQARKPRRFLVGVVKGVHGNSFVIFKRSSSWMPGPGEALEWRPRNAAGKGGSLERSPERRGTLFVADIRSGTPEVGDLVYYHEIPGAPVEITETIGSPGDSAPGETADDRGLESLARGMASPDSPSSLPALRPPPEDRPDPAFPPAANDATSATDDPSGEPKQSPTKPPEDATPPPPGGPQLPALRPPPD